MPFSKQNNDYEQNLKNYIADVVPQDEILVDAPETETDMETVTETDAETDMETNAETAAKKPAHSDTGHRARLLKKAMQERLSDAELLELLLFYAIPRRNTSDIAHKLLGKYDSLEAVLRAEPKVLKSIDGVGDNVAVFLKSLNDLCSRYKLENPKRQPLTVSTTYAEFWSFLDEIYANEPKEVVDVYLLDSESKIFACQRLAEGDISSVEFTAAALAKIIIDAPPAGLFIVHNHPQGTSKPSRADKDVTKKCQVLCSLHNVMFCDHIIYARGQVYSYYESGKMQPISVDFAIQNVVGVEE